ncbi:MAG: CinA family protein [Methanobacteriota archaeon]|nr:MAG: CinA family protein [Euryarchaeota archaeon]
MPASSVDRGVEVLASEIGGKLRRSKKTIAVAESCTGGKLGDMITEVPGSSDYFLGGVISYSNDAKVNILGVDRAIIEEKGAVSDEVALMMAEGVRNRFGADIGVGITGIAGPTGATPEKPVGLVCIAVSSSDFVERDRTVFPGDRGSVKNQAAIRALEMLNELLRG